MKSFVFLFIILLIVFAVNAQPTHYANTYTVGKDNPLEDFNQLVFTNTPSTKLLHLSNYKQGADIYCHSLVYSSI